MDQIEINGLRVMARHGYTKEEKMMEQEFEIDTILYCSLEKAIETDKVEITLYTESAISMEDIKSIYFEAHVFDSYPIEKYIDYEIIKVTAWENKAE